MEYNLWIPVMNKEMSKKDKEALIRELNRVKPSLVFLDFRRTVNHPKMLADTKATFLRNEAFLEENGFKVAAWIGPTIGCGGCARTVG